MSKSFKRIATIYTVTAKIFNRETFDFTTVNLQSASKSETLIKKTIAKAYDCKAADIKIMNIDGSTTATKVTIHASLDDIIHACAAAGIEVTQEDINNAYADTDINNADTDGSDIA